MRKIRQKCWTTQNVGFLMQGLKWRSSKCLVVRGGGTPVVRSYRCCLELWVWRSEAEAESHSASQPTDWFSTARAARQQPITHKVLWLFVLHTKKLPSSPHRWLCRRPANKGILGLSHLFPGKGGAGRGVCVHWLTGCDWLVKVLTVPPAYWHDTSIFEEISCRSPPPPCPCSPVPGGDNNQTHRELSRQTCEQEWQNSSLHTDVLLNKFNKGTCG